MKFIIFVIYFLCIFQGVFSDNIYCSGHDACKNKEWNGEYNIYCGGTNSERTCKSTTLNCLKDKTCYIETRGSGHDAYQYSIVNSKEAKSFKLKCSASGSRDCKSITVWCPQISGSSCECISCPSTVTFKCVRDISCSSVSNAQIEYVMPDKYTIPDSIWYKDTSHTGKRPDCPFSNIQNKNNYLWNTLDTCKKKCINEYTGKCNVVSRYGSISKSNTEPYHCRFYECPDPNNFTWIDQVQWGNYANECDSYILPIRHYILQNHYINLTRYINTTRYINKTRYLNITKEILRYIDIEKVIVKNIYNNVTLYNNVTREIIKIINKYHIVNITNVKNITNFIIKTVLEYKYNITNIDNITNYVKFNWENRTRWINKTSYIDRTNWINKTRWINKDLWVNKTRWINKTRWVNNTRWINKTLWVNNTKYKCNKTNITNDILVTNIVKETNISNKKYISPNHDYDTNHKSVCNCSNISDNSYKMPPVLQIVVYISFAITGVSVIMVILVLLNKIFSWCIRDIISEYIDETCCCGYLETVKTICDVCCYCIDCCHTMEEDETDTEIESEDNKNNLEMTPHIVTASPVDYNFGENKISQYLEMGAHITDETVTTPGGTVIRRRRMQI